MRTKWGTCNSSAKRILLNLELAKKKREYIEYIVVHEMIHRLERTHSKRFFSIITAHLPEWPELKKGLSESPLGHTDWSFFSKVRCSCNLEENQKK